MVGVRVDVTHALHLLFRALWQTIASASTVYNVPWPPAFMSFISSLRVFLIDVVSITKASCTQPMNYYASMMLALLGLKLAVVLLLLLPWVWGKLIRSRLRIVHGWRARQVRSQV